MLLQQLADAQLPVRLLLLSAELGWKRMEVIGIVFMTN